MYFIIKCHTFFTNTLIPSFLLLFLLNSAYGFSFLHFVHIFVSIARLDGFEPPNNSFGDYPLKPLEYRRNTDMLHKVAGYYNTSSLYTQIISLLLILLCHRIIVIILRVFYLSLNRITSLFHLLEIITSPFYRKTANTALFKLMKFKEILILLPMISNRCFN